MTKPIKLQAQNEAYLTDSPNFAESSDPVVMEARAILQRCYKSSMETMVQSDKIAEESQRKVEQAKSRLYKTGVLK